jgi:ribosome-associated translation inhibitor RaiA
MAAGVQLSIVSDDDKARLETPPPQGSRSVIARHQITEGLKTMELSIRTRAIETTDELRELVTRRLQFALDTFTDRIDGVSVYLMDLNGPRRGVDKLCQITVRVRGIGSLAVLERASTPAGALGRATRRLKYRVAEALRRSVELSAESIRTSSQPA